MDTNDVSQAEKLVVSEILKNFKSIAAGTNKKSLKLAEEDGDRVKSLIKEYDLFNEHTKALGVLDKPQSVILHQKLMYKLIRIGVIHQGFVSNSTLRRFQFNADELQKKITYRKLVANFVSDQLLDENFEVMQPVIIEEAKKGEEVDINKMSDEYHGMSSELKLYSGSGEFTKEEVSIGWVTLSDLKNRDKSLNHKRFAKIENLCYYITHKSSNPGSSLIYRDKILSLSTSNLEAILTFICKKLNEHNKEAINAKRKADKRLKSKVAYVLKKALTVAEKRTLIQDLKTEGKNQNQVALLLGCSERTVRNYWK